MRLIVILLVGTAVMLFLPTAWADSVSLTPGQQAVTPGDNTGAFNPNLGASGYNLEDELSASLGPDISAVEFVYLNTTTGGQDFFVQLHNPLGTVPIDALNFTSFAGYQTSVGFINLGGEVDPTGADRAAAGDVVTFDFSSTLTGASSWLEIDTNATSFAQNAVIGFASDTPGSFDGPAGAVPEPASAGLVIGALALMAIVARRKSAQKA